MIDIIISQTKLYNLLLLELGVRFIKKRKLQRTFLTGPMASLRPR